MSLYFTITGEVMLFELASCAAAARRCDRSFCRYLRKRIKVISVLRLARTATASSASDTHTHIRVRSQSQNLGEKEQQEVVARKDQIHSPFLGHHQNALHQHALGDLRANALEQAQHALIGVDELQYLPEAFEGLAKP